MPGDVAEIARLIEEPGVSVTCERGCESGLGRIIERARQGDAAAFDDVMIHYQRRVVNTARRMLGNQEDARDAAQEVFLRLFKYLKSYKQGQDFDGWLYRIVINVCRDLARKRPPTAISSCEAERGFRKLDDIAATGDIEDQAIQSQHRSIVAEALATLSTKEREALVLRDLEGFSTEEVAKLLGSSQTTVRSQVCSARRKIKLFKDRLTKQRRG